MKLDERTDAYLNALAAELSRLREEAGLSKNRLAEKAGLSQQMVSYVEKRMKQPTAGTLYRLAEALGTTVGAITTEADTTLVLKMPKAHKPLIRYVLREDRRPGLVAEEGVKPRRSAVKADVVSNAPSKARRKKA